MKSASPSKLCLKAEYSGAEFGDLRLSKRLVYMGEEMSEHPEASFPRIFDDAAALEASYRFFNNPRVNPEKIMTPHVNQTANRARAYDEVLIAHDTTEFNFGHSDREGLGYLGKGKSRGFLGHFSLTLAPDDSKQPLGTLAVETFSRPKPKKGRKKKRTHKERQRDPGNESHRWLRGVQKSEAALDGKSQAIHMMDREGDNYALLAAMKHGGHRFVVRTAHDRLVLNEDEKKLREMLQKQPVLGKRTVQVCKRDRTPTPAYRKKFPTRAAREATVSISAVEVTLPRPRSSSESPHESVTLNVVRVFESDPSQDETAVEWILWTTEPIDTVAQVWRIVDIYRARWVIEEFFKALKTGCSFEDRQLESADALLRALALTIPVAWRLLLLRTLCRYDEKTPASAALTQPQLACLRGDLKRVRVTLPDKPSVRDALLGIAKLGGHLKRNGEPGWIVLGRGFEKLLHLVQGYLIGRGKM